MTRRRLIAGGAGHRAGAVGVTRRWRRATPATPRRPRTGYCRRRSRELRGGAAVDHRANGFDPARDRARLRLGQHPPPRERPRAARVGAGRGRPGDRGRARRPVRRLDLQRPHPRARRCAHARASGCGSRSSTAPPTRTRSTSTASTRPSMDGVPGLGGGRDRARRPHGLRVRRRCRPGCTSTTATSGRWPSTSPRGSTARSSSTPKDGREDADELVMVMNGFDTNFDRANEVYAANTIGFAYMDRPIEVAAGRARARLPRQRARVRPRSTRSTCTGTSSTTSRPAPAQEPSEFTDTVMLCQGQRGILEWRFPYPGRVHVPRAPVRVHRARLAGLLRGQR